MSSVYTLLPVGGDDQSLPTIDIAEQSMKYEISCWDEASLEYGGPTSFEELSAQDVIGVAVKMLQVVLYQYPELFTEIERQVDELMPRAFLIYAKWRMSQAPFCGILYTEVKTAIQHPERGPDHETRNARYATQNHLAAERTRSNGPYG